MKFSQIILNTLKLIFNKNQLEIIEQTDNRIKLKKGHTIIVTSHNPLENSNTLWIGKENHEMYLVEIDNHTLQSFFKSDLQLSHVSVPIFTENLALFFENEGKLLLNDDSRIIDELEKYDLERAQKYTSDLLLKQNMVRIDEEWNAGNYTSFVNLIDKIDLHNLPPSYRLKYKIALKK